MNTKSELELLMFLWSFGLKIQHKKYHVSKKYCQTCHKLVFVHMYENHGDVEKAKITDNT